MDFVTKEAKKFNRENKQVQEELLNAENLRKELLNKFPIEKWEKMEIEDYSIGVNNKDAYCHEMEYHALSLGSIKGGFALQKHGIYRRKDGEWAYNSKKFSSIEEAWEYYRTRFYQILLVIKQNPSNFEEQIYSIDYKKELYPKMIFLKTIYLYYPELVLPIYAKSNWLYKIAKFLGIKSYLSLDAFTLNRRILKELRAREYFKEWSNHELAIFLRESLALGSEEKVSGESSVGELNEKLLPDISPDYLDESIKENFTGLRDALLRKQQVILYGPPGTGKTFTARQYSVFTLKKSLESLGKWKDDNNLSFEEIEEKLKEKENLVFLTFHPSYGYEEFIEGFKPIRDTQDTSNSSGIKLDLVDGVFKKFVRNANKRRDEPFIMIIDEFNRGNISKILGETITILENDKRGFSVKLPLSQENFSIPSNVFLIATLNTENQGVKAIDLAIRRRFAFIEFTPDTRSLLNVKIEKLNLGGLLKTLNKRIQRLLGKEKQIGHSYFMSNGKPIDTQEKLALAFKQDILPLIEENCYNDYDLVKKILSSSFVNKDSNGINWDLIDSPEDLIDELIKIVNEG